MRTLKIVEASTLFETTKNTTYTLNISSLNSKRDPQNKESKVDSSKSI